MRSTGFAQLDASLLGVDLDLEVIADSDVELAAQGSRNHDLTSVVDLHQHP